MTWLSLKEKKCLSWYQVGRIFIHTIWILENSEKPTCSTSVLATAPRRRGNPFKWLEGVWKKSISLNPFQSLMLCLDSDNYYSRTGTISRKGHYNCLVCGSKKNMKVNPSLGRQNFPFIALGKSTTISIIKIWFLGTEAVFNHSSDLPPCDSSVFFFF